MNPHMAYMMGSSENKVPQHMYDGSDRHFSYAMAILGQSHIGLISYNHTTSIYPPPK